MKRLMKPIGMVLLGMLGMGVFQAVYHGWKDHQNLHAVIKILVAQQQQK